MDLELSAPQYEFIYGLDTKYRAFVGGFGSGKTFVGCIDLLLFAARYPGTVQGYFAPSYPLLRDIFYPTFDEAAELLGFSCDINVSDKEVKLSRDDKPFGSIICRSMDRPTSIIGFKIARALVDEIDTMPKNKAEQAWNKIIARLRLNIPGVVNGVGVTTTPEGFGFVYERFARAPTASYSMVQATTHENAEHLPPDYIATLRETYSDELVEAYINGRFVNLQSGTVYHGYDRQKNRSKAVRVPNEPVHVGLDFNVRNMSAVVYVVREGVWHAVDELVGMLDTPTIAAELSMRYGKCAIYPDASGAATRSTNAAVSDIGILEAVGHVCHYDATNPPVRDRVNASNKAFKDLRVLVNDARCPELARCLEQLPYDQNGAPDKKSGLDHLPDAGTYPIAHIMPIIRPASNLKLSFAR